jgi:DNA-damage-inducible protein D
MENGLTPFENNGIRKMIHDDEWYFSVVDVIEVLTDSPMPKRYWTDLKRRSEKESGQGYAFCVPLKMIAKDGRSRLTDCANTQGILRIIMSVPSPKAEPLKLWLAEQGKRTIDETENPELLTQRQIDLYKAKGYPEEWIKRHMESIQTRNLLTDEWQKRGVEKGTEYSVLTAIIAKGTFEVTPTEHREIKGLSKPNQNLRDHMTPLELIFTALGEEMTRRAAISDDAQGFSENKSAAVQGGYTAGEARKRVEEIEGKKVVSDENFLKKDSENDNKELPPSK